MREFLSSFAKPSHYLGIEPGVVRKDPSSVRARIALAFPDLYEIGMSYLGLAILYHQVNQVNDLWAERVFLPAPEVCQVMEKKGLTLATLESDTPVSSLDAFGFSLTHELCYTNVLHMLHLAGLPLWAKDREERWPLVMAGGGCAYAAEPLTPFLDLLLLGDGEEILPEIMSELAQARAQGLAKKDFLQTLAGRPGIYIPTRGVKCTRRTVSDFDAISYPVNPPAPFEAVHNRLVLEVARGCTRSCRFCQAGMIYRPVRERSIERLAALVLDGLKQSGHTEMSFLSLSLGDFSDLPGLFKLCMPMCAKRQVAISLPSLRVGSVDDEIMRQIAGIRRTGATLAPEAGSERMRAFINKGITEEDLLEQVRTLRRLGWRQVKLYFMIGLPTETEEDLYAIRDLCLKVARDHSGEGGRIQVTAAVSTFVPKAHTPFQWEAQLSLEETRHRINFLKDIFAPCKGLSLKWHKPEMSFLEGLLSRAGREFAPVLEKAWQNGAILCSWTDHLRLEPWIEAMAECGLEPSRYFEPRDLHSPLPWDHLDCGVNREFFLAEREKAFKLSPTLDCRFHGCVNCGACSGTLRLRLNQRQKQLKSGHSHTEERPAVVEKDGPRHGNRLLLGNKVQRLRLRYQKSGAAAYLSQLEIQASFERIMRKAELPLAFSQGFHPMPLISFGRALPVGVSSLDEYADVVLHRRMALDEVVDRLRGLFPEGLDLLQILELDIKKSTLESAAEDFCLHLDDRSAVAGQVIEQWNRFWALSSFELTLTDKQGRTKVKEIRPLVTKVAIGRNGDIDFSVDWRGGYFNPLRLVKAICPGLTEPDFRLTKLRQHFLAS